MRNAIVGPILDEHVHAGSRVLDLGGFDGSATEALVGRGAKVSLVDLDDDGIQMARSKGINAVNASAENIPFPDKSFDVVVCCDLLPSVPYDAEEPIFREIGRVLTDDGVLVMTVPDSALSLPFVDMKAAYTAWRSREGLSYRRLTDLLQLANVDVVHSQDYFGLPARLYYSLAFYKNLPRGATRIKRRLWRYLVAGESYWCPAPQAHLIIAKSRNHS